MIGFAIGAVLLLIVILMEDRLDFEGLERKKEVNFLADEALKKERRRRKWR